MEHIYLIRHAESEANDAGIYQGQSFNVGLTEKGIKQAELTGESLANLKGVSAIYFSPLLRAYETAAIIERRLKTPTPMVMDERLIEINHGSWEGKTVDQFNQEEKNLLNLWKSQPAEAQMINGETIMQVSKRVAGFLQDLSLAKGKIVVVTHDVPVRITLCLCQQQPFNSMWQYQLDNCGITVLGANNSEIIELNNTIHLNGQRSLTNRQAL